MIRLPWRRRSPPEPSPEVARAVSQLAEQTARVAEQLERSKQYREGKTA